MKSKTNDRQFARLLRHSRVRKKIKGTTDRPRLVVFRSNKHIYAQLVDDVTGHTLATASSLEKGFREKKTSSSNKEGAALVGSMIAQKAKSKGIERVVFDRNGYMYHGRVKALAESAREGGLVL